MISILSFHIQVCIWTPSFDTIFFLMYKGSVGTILREFAGPECPGNNQWQWRDEMEMPASWVGENKF